MSTKSHLQLMALYPSLLVSSTAKTALVELEKLEDENPSLKAALLASAGEIERLEASLAIAVEALERIADTDPDDGIAWFHRVAGDTLAQIKEAKNG